MRAGWVRSGFTILEPAEIRAIGNDLHAATSRSFALNLWVSTHDLPERDMTRERFEAAVRRLGPLYDEVGVAAPVYPERFAPSFESQAEAVLAARPAAFSTCSASLTSAFSRRSGTRES